MSTVYNSRRKKNALAFDSNNFSTTSKTMGVKSLAATQANTLHTMTDDQMHSGRRMIPNNATPRYVPTISIDINDLGNK